jgi:hypothetical protein
VKDAQTLPSFWVVPALQLLSTMPNPTAVATKAALITLDVR